MAKRGNPNWIRAAEARRQSALVEVVEEPNAVSQQEQSTLMELLTPFAGAAAGALALEKGPAMLGIPADQFGLGLATLGMLTAFNTTGPVRQIAITVAAQATVQELLRWLAPPPSRVAVALEPLRRQTDAPQDGFITKSELMQVVAGFETNAKKVHAAMIEELRPLLDELRVARTPMRERRFSRREEAQPESPLQLDEEPLSDSPEEVGAPVESPPQQIEEPARMLSTDEKAERLHAVYEQLLPEERELLSKVIGTFAKTDVDRVTDQLSTLPLEQAVEYVRAALPRVALQAAT